MAYRKQIFVEHHFRSNGHNSKRCKVPHRRKNRKIKDKNQNENKKNKQKKTTKNKQTNKRQNQPQNWTIFTAIIEIHEDKSIKRLQTLSPN